MSQTQKIPAQEPLEVSDKFDADSFFKKPVARPGTQANSSKPFPGREQLQAIWRGTKPTALDGTRRMWETPTDRDFVLFTAPAKLDSKTIQYLRLTTGNKEADGVQYRWQKDGAWVGKASAVLRHEVFEQNGPKKPSIALLKRPAEKDAPAIVLAASLDRGDVCRQLIADGADPDAVDLNGWSALTWAAWHDFTTC